MPKGLSPEQNLRARELLHLALSKHGSETELERLTGIKQYTWSRCKTGKGGFSYDTAAELCKLMGVDPGTVFGHKPMPARSDPAAQAKMLEDIGVPEEIAMVVVAFPGRWKVLTIGSVTAQHAKDAAAGTRRTPEQWARSMDILEGRDPEGFYGRQRTRDYLEKGGAPTTPPPPPPAAVNKPAVQPHEERRRRAR